MIYVTFYFMAFCYLFICCFFLQLRRGNLCKCYFSFVQFKFQVRSKVGFYSTYILCRFTAHIFFAPKFFAQFSTYIIFFHGRGKFSLMFRSFFSIENPNFQVRIIPMPDVYLGNRAIKELKNNKIE